MKNVVRVSSPGKLIVGGEHAVVYGRRALVTSVGMRLYMQLTEEEEEEKVERETRLLNVHFHDTNTYHSINLNSSNDTNEHEQSPVELRAIRYVDQHFNSISQRRIGRLDLQVRSQIPIGAGLGSSAAYSVCLAGCFFLLHHGIQTFDRIQREQINQLAFEVECLFHGTPSGIDNTISTFGQSLVYSTATKKQPKHMESHWPSLAIIDTGIPKSTKRMVDLVRQFVETNRIEGEEILNEIEKCVDTMVDHPEQMNMIFERNQQLLARLGVSTPEIDSIIQTLANVNIPAKITGAGGGGCLIALASPSTSGDLLALLKKHRIKSLEFVECGVEGLRQESSFFLSSF